jgi:hypothetical protein
MQELELTWPQVFRKIGPLILPVFNALLWSVVAVIVFATEKSDDPIFGHRSLGPFELRVAIPLIMLIGAIIPPLLLSLKRWPRLGNAWAIITLLLLAQGLYVSAGGI